MARIPEGGELVANSVSVAPGFKLGNVIVMTCITEGMIRTGRKMHSVEIDLLRPEGEIAAKFEGHQKEFPDVPMGSYPFFRDNKPPLA